MHCCRRPLPAAAAGGCWLDRSIAAASSPSLCRYAMCARVCKQLTCCYAATMGLSGDHYLHSPGRLVQRICGCSREP